MDMEENKTIKEIQCDVDTIRTCKFIDLKGKGLIIKLEGFLLSYIKITNENDSHQYTILFRDNDGWIYSVKKNVDGELLGATIKKVIEEIRT